MRVDVDEPRRDDTAVGVELTLAVQIGADRDDAAVADRDVGTSRLGARAVDDGATLDRDVVAHRSASLAAAFSFAALTPRMRSRSWVTGGPALVPPSIGSTIPVIWAERSLAR